MYDWRNMTESEREYARKLRRTRRFPKHSPPHFDFIGEHPYLLTGSCFQHQHIIGTSPERMTDCEQAVVQACAGFSAAIYSWCVLPNHYHILLKTSRITDLRKALGQFHGRSSFAWNGEDSARGRQVWHNCFERKIKSERHFWVSLNYIMHNPVHHGYVKHWQDWQWSNAAEYLEKTGKDKALQIWRDYPILDYGKKWDVD